MLTVDVRGFQSLRKPGEVKIERFTTITGDSHLGKSALIRALEAAADNRKGTEFISSDENNCRVKVVYPDIAVTWDKSNKGSSQYTVGDVLFAKTGKESLAEVANALGIHTITTLDGTTHTPQIQGQHDTPFLLSREYSPSTVSELIGSNTDVAKLSRSIRLLRADLKVSQVAAATKKEIHTKQQVRLDSLEFAQKSLKAFDKVYGKRVSEIEQDHLRIGMVVETVVAFKDILEKRDKFLPLDRLQDPTPPQEGLVTSLRVLTETYRETLVPSNLKIPVPLPALRLENRRLVSLGNLEAEIRNFAKPIDGIPTPIPESGIDHTRIQILHETVKAVRVKTLLEKVPQVLATVILPNRLTSLEVLTLEIGENQLYREMQLPVGPTEAPIITSLVELKALMVELLRIKSTLSSLRNGLEVLEPELEEAEAEILSIRQEAVASGTCLVCGR